MAICDRVLDDIIDKFLDGWSNGQIGAHYSIDERIVRRYTRGLSKVAAVPIVKMKKKRTRGYNKKPTRDDPGIR